MHPLSTPLRPGAAVALLLALVATLVTSPFSPADAELLPDGECYVIDVLYDDGATDAGTYCGTGNELTAAEHGTTAPVLHVSCSDQFPGGVPEKSDLGGRLVVEWSIEKYKDGDLDKVCGSPAALDLPDGVTADGECVVVDFLYDDGSRDAGTICDAGNDLKADEHGISVPKLHVSCSDEFPLGFGEKSELGGKRVAEWSIERFKDGALEEQCSGVEDTTLDVVVGEQCWILDFVYDDGATDAGVFCTDSNDVTRTEFPGLAAVSIHTSCSDEFPGGYGEKSDLDGRRALSWSIQRWHDDHLHDPCGDEDTSDDGYGPLPDGVTPFDECYVIDFVYDDGATDSGAYCDSGNELTSAEDGTTATTLHVSCSDQFPGGYAEKSDLDGRRVLSWSIQKWKDGTLDEECGDDDTTDDGVPERPDGVQPDGDCVVIDFRYSTGEVDAGTYCGTGNDIDRTEAPGLNAVELHVSCSDDFNADGTAEKSDLGGLLVSSWSILKYKDGELDKQCGGTGAPLEVEYCYDIDFTYRDDVTSGGGGFDAGRYCGDAVVDRTDDPYLEAISLDVSCTEQFGPNGEPSTSVLPDGWRVVGYSITIRADGVVVDSCSGSF